MSDHITDWIESVAPGHRAVVAELGPRASGGERLKHTPATQAVCERIVRKCNAELRAKGCRSADTVVCSQSCIVCRALAERAEAQTPTLFDFLDGEVAA